MLKQITPLQWIGIVILFNTTLLGSASQLGDLSLAKETIKFILALATIGNGFLGGLVTMFGGASAMRDLLANRGDVVVTSRANANALPDNPNVIATTPAAALAATQAGAVAPPVTPSPGAGR